MALRRASLSVLKALQVQSAGHGARPAAACMQFSTATTPVTDSRRSSRDAFDRVAYQRNFTQQLHSESQSKNDDHETFHYESSKMTAEGGGAEEKTFQEKSSEILQTKKEKLAASGEGKTEEVEDKAKDTVQEVSETATELKEVGIEAGKAVVRDTGKLAEKVGISSETTGKVSETATELKEVGQEAGKAVVRDAKKVAEKVGLK